ncbi:NAD(P)/FAD-dependent oxidoreductase [Pseudomonas aeruginosa]|nr:NAD(P)/FAD-dependent oxidoreductase [Pseudomonas aeruginosa]
MADLLTEQIRLNCPVHAIEQDTQGVRVLCAQGTFHARRVIMTVPPALASRISYEPALPAKRASLIRRMPMGCVIKIHVAYPTPFWRSRGLSGAVISPNRALSMVFDQTPLNGEVGILVGLIEGEHAVELSEIGPDARRARVMADLVHYFGADAAQPLEYVDHDWIHETWTEGGYGAHMPPGVMTTYGEAIREPHGRIHWAGTGDRHGVDGLLRGRHAVRHPSRQRSARSRAPNSRLSLPQSFWGVSERPSLLSSSRADPTRTYWHDLLKRLALPDNSNASRTDTLPTSPLHL